jgi:hypothetical protein
MGGKSHTRLLKRHDKHCENIDSENMQLCKPDPDMTFKIKICSLIEMEDK